MTHSNRTLFAIGIPLFTLIAACGSTAAPPGDSAAPPEVREATRASATVDAMNALAASGWSRASAEPRIERDASGKWGVAFAMERPDGAHVDVVYAASPTPTAVVRADDDATRASLLADGGPSTDTDVGCTTGCDAPSTSCVAWSCTYVSLIGASFGCVTFGNPFGIYHVVTRRVGRTDPSQCASPYMDIHGTLHSCPAPSNASNLFVCGWA